MTIGIFWCAIMFVVFIFMAICSSIASAIKNLSDSERR